MKKNDLRKKPRLDRSSSCIALHDWSVQELALALNQKVAISYDVFLDKILNVVEITSLGNGIVVVTVGKLLPDLRL
jgi:hypothetical protein